MNLATIAFSVRVLVGETQIAIELVRLTVQPVSSYTFPSRGTFILRRM